MARQKRITVTSYGGSGQTTVSGILNELGAKLQIVNDRERARTAPMTHLLLLGGNDVNPFFYGEEARLTGALDSRRDTVEWTLVRRAITNRIPIFGICRGMQLLAVSLGGSLYQDIEMDGASPYHPSPWEHRLRGIDRELARRIPSHYVNSRHHQAVRRLPPGLRVLARSEDGLIEAIYRGGMLGVQWHPEDMALLDERWLWLFQWFLEGLR